MTPFKGAGSVVMIIAIFVLAVILALAANRLLFLDLTGQGRRKAMQQFPAAAKTFGFVRQKSRASQPIGVYAGTYKGYAFKLTPDNNATIELQMKPVEGIREIMTKKGDTNFKSSDPQFNSLFKTRLISAELGQRLDRDKHFLAFAAQFAKQWRWESNYIQIYPDSIYCALKYGNGRYIPASVLKQIIPEMVELANRLQTAAKGT
jgi:hypothetical protein